MKAMKLRSPGGLEALELVDISDPGAPGPGAIRVKVQGSTLNYHDLSVVLGRIPAQDGRIPLADCGGTVEAVGEGVTEFKVGDSVVSCFFPQWLDGGPEVESFDTTPGDGTDGFAREVVVAPATHFTRSPAGYSAVEAATITTAGLTAWRALVVEGGLKAGDVVLTLGTGGVSIIAMQIAKAMGATVIVTSSSDAKLKRTRLLGADHLINYRSDPDWGNTVRELTGGRGADHVIELGGAGTLAQSINACRIGGHIALIGVLSGFGGEVPTALLMRRQQRLQGIIVGSRKHQQDFCRALEVMPFRPVVDRVFPLEQLADAFRYEMGGQHYGKIGVAL